MKRIISAAILIFTFCFAAFAQASENPCPKIEIISPSKTVVTSTFAPFSVKVGSETENLNIEYVWTASSGEIIIEPGTPNILLFLIKEDFGANITLTVKVKGLPKDCVDTISGVFPVVPPRIIDPPYYGKVSRPEEMEYLDRIAWNLEHLQDFLAVLNIYADKNTSKIKVRRHLQRIFSYLTSSERWKFDKARLIFIVCEDENERTAYWFKNSKINASDYKDCQIIDGENFKQKINELFPKK